MSPEEIAEGVYSASFKMSATKGTVVAAIAQAIRDAQPKWPSGKQIKIAADKTMTSDHCQAAFYKGARWMREFLEGK